MSINKSNYELYSIDYLEDNLPEDLVQEMEIFLQEHPLVREELMQMKAMVLEPDPSIVFAGKEVLLKPVAVKPEVSRKMIVFWTSMAAAILLGGFLLFKTLMPTTINTSSTPIVIEEKVKPSVPIKETPYIHEPEIKLDEIAEEKTTLPDPKPEKTSPVTPILKDLKTINEIVLHSDPVKKPDTIVEDEPVIDQVVVVKNPLPEPPTKQEIIPIKEEKPEQILPIEDVVIQIPVEKSEEAPTDPLKAEEEMELPPKQDIVENPDLITPEPEPPAVDSEEALALATVTEEEVENETNLKTKSKKKKRVFFPKIKEKLSISNLTNALLPEAYSSGSED